MSKVLEKNAYLKGLEELFIKFGITEVYAESIFTDCKVDGVTLYANNVGYEETNQITLYIDPEVVGLPCSTGSICLPSDLTSSYDTNLVYKDGTFYEGDNYNNGDVLSKAGYLGGLEKVLLSLGITEVYANMQLRDKKIDGLCLYIDGTMEQANKITEYIDPEYDGVRVDIGSYCLPLNKRDKKSKLLVYKDGIFYKGVKQNNADRR